MRILLLLYSFCGQLLNRAGKKRFGCPSCEYFAGFFFDHKNDTSSGVLFFSAEEVIGA